MSVQCSTTDDVVEGRSAAITMVRRSLSYDDLLDAPLISPPSNMAVGIFWKKPVIPKRRFLPLPEDEEAETFKPAAAYTDVPIIKAPVAAVKTKGPSVVLSSFLTKQVQESIQRFEQQAGLLDASYTPHKGLTAEETRYHCVSEAVKQLKVPGGDPKEDKRGTSAQSTPSVTPSITPSVTPHPSPNPKRRGWFSQSSAGFLTECELGTDTRVDMGGNEGRAGGERWSLFGMRSVVQKPPCDSGSECSPAGVVSIQDSMKAQVAHMAEPPKLDLPSIEGKSQLRRLHKLKPRDMNVLTPSGF